MKKSKAIAIGLLALSIAGCKSHEVKDDKHRENVNDWQVDQATPDYYIDNGTGFHHGGNSFFMTYMFYRMMSGGRYGAYPVYIYQDRGNNSSYHESSMGKTTTVSKSSVAKAITSGSKASVSRGGFGGKSSTVGA